MNAVQTRRAWIAFWLHAPGLALCDRQWRRALPRGWFVTNVLALGVTLAACAVAGYAWGGWPAFVVWAVGHFGWSVYLAAQVASAPTEEPDDQTEKA